MKGGVITLYERILKEQKRLDKQIEAIKQELSNLPAGKLICCHDGNQCKWYQSDGHKKAYLSKKKASLAEQLARKKYLALKLEDLENEKRALDFYLRHHVKTQKAEALLSESSEYQKLLMPQFTPISTELSNWANSHYEHNFQYPEHLIYKSSSGHFVRSKSEMMIDMLLHMKRIPFRYECALTLADTTIYPDFTIHHPKTGEYYYWEHFGLMDNPGYANSTSSKLRLYITNGIIPGIHLITTYETQSSPLSTEMIERIIEYYFA